MPSHRVPLLHGRDKFPKVVRLCQLGCGNRLPGDAAAGTTPIWAAGPAHWGMEFSTVTDRNYITDRGTPGAPLELELRQLLRTLSKPKALLGLPLAGRLVPRLRERYPDLAGSGDQPVLAHGLARLWREAAGSVPLALAYRVQWERFFALMVRDLYPAQHGLHRFLISSDERIGPVQSFDDPAFRLGHPEYLALVYADGDLERARAVLRDSGTVLRTLAETTLDGLAALPNSSTVYSRWRAAVRVFTPHIEQLLEDMAPSQPPDVPAASAPASEPGEEIDPAKNETPLAERFAGSLTNGMGIAGPAAVVDAALGAVNGSLQGELGRRVARNLAAIHLGLTQPADQTPSLTPANVRLAFRLAHHELPIGGAPDGKVLGDLQAAGLLVPDSDIWRFSSQDLAEWFAAEHLATYSGHCFLPQPRFRRLQLWAANWLALRQDEARNSLLVADMTAAWPGLHRVSALDMAELVAAFGGRETSSIFEMRRRLTPVLRALASGRSAALQAALGQNAAYFELKPDSGDRPVASLIAPETLHQARTDWGLDRLGEALGLPESLLGHPGWFNQRQALGALVGRIEAPDPADLAHACVAWLRKADPGTLLEIHVGRQWPPLRTATLLDRLVHLSGEPRSRDLAMTVLAHQSFLVEVLIQDSPEAQAVGISLLLLTGRRARWNQRSRRYDLLD